MSDQLRLPEIPESFARRIFEIAIRDQRSAELLGTLFDGGSVTIMNDSLVIIPSSAVEGFMSCE